MFTHEARKVDRVELRQHLAHSHLADSVPKSNKLIELFDTSDSHRKAADHN